MQMLRPVLLVSAVGVLASCGPGAAGEAARPQDPTAHDALDEGECRDVQSGGQPLIVDWKPEQRGDLELAMKDGVAVVAYSCDSIELLADCRLDGKYGFMGMTRKEQVVRLENADEIRANLPLSGASLGAELDRGSTIDIAMIMVGKQRTTWDAPSKQDLQGSCDGATHYVRGALVGAFAVDTGTRAKVRAAAEVFGAGASTQSTSKKQVRTKEGDLGACGKASPDAPKAPDQCGAPIRLVLAPIAAKPAAGGEPAAEKPPAVAAAEQPACPAGMVYGDGKCTTPAAAAAYQCKPSDQAECSAQCDKGHAGSCGALGALLANAGDHEKAAAALKKACDGDDTRSCVNLGLMQAKGLGAKQDVAAAVALFEKGCSAGDPVGCRELGRNHQFGNGGLAKDEQRAFGLYETACNGGDMVGCAFAGSVSPDPTRAAGLYKRACDGGHADSCASAGEAYETGRGAPKNAMLAKMVYQRGCWRNSTAACVNLGRLELDKNPDEAKRQFERACNFKRDKLACSVMKIAFGSNMPVMPDGGQLTELLKSCGMGNARDCATYGALQAAIGATAAAKVQLMRACTSGDAFACALNKKL